jgi:tetratricopeptide (TPR) repeat protein
LRGIDALRRGQLEEAERLLSEASETCPLDERIHQHYAETLWQAGLQERAIQTMEQAVKLSGGNAELAVRLGEMYLATGDLQRAERQAEAAIRANAQLASAWALRGDVLRTSGRDRESLASYHRALSFQEHLPAVQLAVADIYRRQGRHGRALATLRALADGYAPAEPPPHVLVLQGIALKEVRRYQAAVEMLSAAVKQSEPTAEILYHLAESQWLAGDPVNARLTLRSALSQSAEQTASQAMTAQLLSLQRELSRDLKL